MSAPLLVKFAVRTMGRNVRRTFLSVVGVGVGCAIALFMTALTLGSAEMRVRGSESAGRSSSCSRRSKRPLARSKTSRPAAVATQKVPRESSKR